MVHLKHKKNVKKTIRYGLVIVSDSRYLELKQGKQLTDETIPKVRQILEEDKQELAWFEIVPDEKEKIKKILQNPLMNTIEILIFSGGTGINPRDVTIESIRPFLEKEINGFGELFRYLSYKEIGTASMLSRALAGTYKGKVIFCLPGSPNAVKLALEQIILKEAGHLLKMMS
ncbi:MAG: MogA/MoaB family molybdenum cofactor biosynthesis protein [Candidatus Helarchaeota archaeon]